MSELLNMTLTGLTVPYKCVEFLSHRLLTVPQSNYTVEFQWLEFFGP